MNVELKSPIKAIIGLGNPGCQYENTRHNIGFKVLDELGSRFNAQWREQSQMEIAQVLMHGKKIELIKPQTFMNNSGRVIPILQKKGISAENLLVVHDELEIPFGEIKIRMGGSARGHNGLKSLIEQCGPAFIRVRFGIGRPENRDDVPAYVLHNFKEPTDAVSRLVAQAADVIEQLLADLER